MEDDQKKILKAFEEAGKPLRPGDIAKMSGLEKGEVSKLIKKMKKDGVICSPKRCYYAPTE